MSYLIAKLWQQVYSVQSWLGGLKRRYGSIVSISILLLFVVISLFFTSGLQNLLAVHYGTEQSIEDLRNLIQNIGAALIGAAAIVTSLVLFAMQVNIERTPQGLFRRLSADPKLLASFLLAFLLALFVTVSSTFIEQDSLALVVLSASWAIIFILVLFMYAYRRALVLINPLQQLGILIKDTHRGFRIWARRATHMMPLLEQRENASATSAPTDPTHDLARVTFFQINNHWTDGAKRAIQYAMSLARRYAEQGDHEVSGTALKAVISINGAYIEAKGKTFFANTPLIDNPLVTDVFINDTLEHLRKNIQSGIARRDEQQIEQTLQAMAALVGVYLGIDYSSPYASKSHAILAAGYLTSAVEAVVPHNMADVLMEGQRLMGKSAQFLLAHGSPEDIGALSEKIAMISCTGCAKEVYRPVTMEGMTQLSDLTFALLRSGDRDISFAISALRRDVALVVKMFLKVPDTPLSNSHSTFLGPYYSSTSTQSLRPRLTALVNAISSAQQDNEDAQAAIRNIEKWADGIYKTEKEILLEAIKVKSPFAFDIIEWIKSVTEILLAVSNADACDQRTAEKLREHANWLIATLTWIPDDKESVAFVETYQVTETLFEAAVDAHNRGCDEVAKQAGKALLSWTFKAGKYQTGWAILGRGLCASAAFALMNGDEAPAALLASVQAHLSGESAPDQRIRDRAARDIRERVATLHREARGLSRIEMGIAHSDHEKLRPLLESIAELLSPEEQAQSPDGQ